MKKTMKTCNLLIVCLTLILLAFPLDLLACACCAESGDNYTETRAPGEQELGILDQLRFSRRASIPTGSPDYEEIKGLDVLKKTWASDENPGDSDLYPWTDDYLTVDFSFDGKAWILAFRTKDGKTGKLTAPMPGQMTSVGMDINDGIMGSGGGPLLYREFRFNGTLSAADGLFSEGFVSGTKFTLVLQGRGNHCVNASDFRGWRLEIEGPKAEYTFLGKMSSANPEAFGLAGPADCFLEKGAASAVVNVPGGAVEMRENDSADSKIVGRIPHGALVPVSQCNEAIVTVAGKAGAWCLVDFKGMYGWVHDSLLTKVDPWAGYGTGTFSVLKGEYADCGCIAQRMGMRSSFGEKVFFTDPASPGFGYFGVGGQDVKLNLVRKGERPAIEDVGSTFADEYESGGTRVTVEYKTVQMLKGYAAYDIVLTRMSDGKTVSEDAVGSCGCGEY